MADKARGDLLLVGLDNPQSNDPRHALFPSPPGCSGYRLMKFMQAADPKFTRMQYVSIQKTNLFPVGACPTKKRTLALARAGALLREQVSGTNRRVVLMGQEVATAVLGEVRRAPSMFEFIKLDGAQYAWIPHPSGRNHHYNDAKARREAGRFLRKHTHVET